MGSMQTALERALPIVAAAYGEQFGVNVILSGNDARTDGKTIVLPMLANMAEMSEVLFGYLAHEAAHVRDSNFAVISLCTSEVEKVVLNIIEDVRIELLMQEVFPGTVDTLNSMWQYIVDNDMSPAAKVDDNEATQLVMYVLHRVRYEYAKRESFRALFEASEAIAKETFPEGFFVRLDVLLNKHMPKLKTSQDCLTLARRILQSLKEAEEEEREKEKAQQQQSNQGPDSDDDGSTDSSDDAGCNSDDNADNNSDDDGQGSGGADDSADTSGQPGDQSGSDSQSPQSQSSQDADGSPDDSDSTDSDDGAGSGASSHARIVQETDLPADATEALKADMQEQARETNQDTGPFSLDTDSVGPTVANTGDTNSLQAGILTSSRIRARLVGLLQAQSRQDDYWHHRGSRISGRRLTKAMTGDTRIYNKREETRRPDTAVHVLLDASGSMSKIQNIANQAAVSLALAVSSVPQCDIAMSVFPGVGAAVSPMIDRGQPLRPNLGRCAIRSSGGTPLGEAMLYAARELATAHKEKRVLIVVTDGEPNDPGSVRYMTKLLEPFVDIYAIGINSTSVRSLFKKSAVINSVEELQAALFSIAGRFLDLH
ncbi:von Willebrand factor, type A [gamma proteobacterium BDW918]|nr:von Willebrand factor, type A [gamma proteobacterium BDW918]